jgi:hypothetical protein
MKAKDFLKQAEKTLNEDRQDQYGSFGYNLEQCAKMWEGYAETPLDAIDVALMMAIFKINRIRANKNHLDSYVDALAYIAGAAEISQAGSASSSSSSSSSS